MPKNIENNERAISEQISFRHSKSVKTMVEQLTKKEDLRESDVCRRIFNAGLKTLHNVEVQGNQVI